MLPKDFRRQPDGTVTLHDLAGTGLVWFPHDQLPLIRARILSAFRQAGHPVDIVLDVNRTLTVISCVAAGCGVSLLSHSIHTFAFEIVAYSTIRDGGALPLFELSAIWPARSRPTLADRFAALLPSADVQR
ncbi:LysR substrate binding domain-containing protein [Burkholderia cepacia]|nr:LysR substrate binding domain-containing protein [Burkholderia cepacia]